MDPALLFILEKFQMFNFVQEKVLIELTFGNCVGIDILCSECDGENKGNFRHLAKEKDINLGQAQLSRV